jgi:HAE1 family hydrophobic/amphiphilic exporter-1
MKLPEISVRRPVSVTMLFLGILALGLLSLKFLPIDLMPKVSLPAMAIVTIYPGASPEDVETLVTEVIEDYVATVPNLKEIESRSVENISVVSLRFNWGTEMGEAANDVRSRLDMAKRWLPEDIEPPAIYKFDMDMWPILFYGVTADENYPKLRKLLEDKVINPLKRLEGVALVMLVGGPEREIHVNVNKEKMESLGISMNQIINAIKAENLTIPTGHIKFGMMDYTVRTPGEFRSISEIEDVIVGFKFKEPLSALSFQNPVPVRLREIATVEDSFKEKETIVRVNGKPGLLMMIQKQSGANTVEVADRVRKAIEELQKRLPSDVHFELVVDASDFIRRAIENLRDAVVIGGLLVILVVFLFLREIKGSFIIGLSIPFSLIVAFIFLFITGSSINMFSLFSLAIAIGMVVDDAIVIYENIYRHHSSGLSPEESAVTGASEVGLAVTASTFTIVMVFLPIIFIKGITGILFKELGLIVCVTILTSLLVSLTLTPMLASRLLKIKGGIPIFDKAYVLSEKWYNALEGFYEKVISFAIRKPVTVISTGIAVFAFSLFSIKFIGTEFHPEEDPGHFGGILELPVGTRVELTDRVNREIEEIAKKEIPELKSFITRAGPTETGWGTIMGTREDTYTGMMMVRLIDKEKRKRSAKEISYFLEKKVKENVPGPVKIEFSMQDPMASTMFGGIKPVALEIYGDDLEALKSVAYQVFGMVKEIPGTQAVSMTYEEAKPEKWVSLSRARAMSFGLPFGFLAMELRAGFEGISASKYREKGEDYDIVVRLSKEYRDEIDDLRNFPLISPYGGRSTRLFNLADITERKGPLEILRKSQSRMIRVEADVYKRPLGDVVNDIKKRLSSMTLPEGVDISFGGQVKEQREAFSALGLAFVLAVFLVYAILASQFESLVDPFIIMFAVPFAITGVLLGLLITRNTLNIVSIVGAVVLVGIVVKNSIVLVDYMNILLRRGMKLEEAIRTGAKRRLRPVLMTAFTTMLGMVPLVLMRKEGAEAWRPLGIAVISGLFVSTMITLIFVPSLYKIVKRRKFA